MNVFTKIMPWKHWVASLALVTLLGATMTMPQPLADSIPGALTNRQESPVVARIGTVVDISESDNITVRISGSDVLVTASYLFPMYAPLLGDFVYVTKQDSQWFVVGTMSGPINSAIANASFEEGTVGALPTGWTTNVVASPAGVPTFTKEVAAYPLAGTYSAMIRNASAGAAGTSIIDIFSPQAEAMEGQRWASGFFLLYAVINVNAALVVQSGNTQLQSFIQFLDGTGTLISEESTYVLYLGSNVIVPFLVRTVNATTQGSFVNAPINTSFVRLRLRATLTMNANSLTEIYIDHVMLRTPDA
jgi:hypothetical protein